jgi:heme/copper-type cytochrome/quinol oxidase subunit 4
MLASFKTAITLAWIVLFAATVVSWSLVQEGTQVTSLAAGIAILSLAFFKVRLILLYFMELRFAPQPWRAIFEIWVMAVWAAVVYLYVIGL